jgi:predicted site-specific integrase-resolvase
MMKIDVAALEKALMLPGHVLKELDICGATLFRWVKDGVLTPLYIHGRTFFRREDVKKCKRRPLNIGRRSSR